MGRRAPHGSDAWGRPQPGAVSLALGELPAPGPRQRSDRVNTNVLGHAGKTWALVEAGGTSVELGDELQTVAHNPFEGSLKGSFTAHPHRDTASGEMQQHCLVRGRSLLCLPSLQWF